jgi:sulfatase modifying factor 1
VVAGHAGNYAAGMTTLVYEWRHGDETHELRLVPVPGTAATPYLFGREPHRRPIHVRDFFIGAVPVTQALWLHVMGENPALRPAPRAPVENVSWNQLHDPGGFLDRINSGEILASFAREQPMLRFRLPTESEWEYAARGGPSWTDGFTYSGSNDPDAVAWYGTRWTRPRRFGMRLLGRRGWRLLGRQRFRPHTETHEVATKQPNQLGAFDMSGNVWEWCQDGCSDDLDDVPSNGGPCLAGSNRRRLRGGCHHNWDIHCTVAFRYGIEPDAHDGCIGFRLILAPA